jgi:hypothetical protein
MTEESHLMCKLANKCGGEGLLEMICPISSGLFFYNINFQKVK